MKLWYTQGRRYGVFSQGANEYTLQDITLFSNLKGTMGHKLILEHNHKRAMARCRKVMFYYQ